MKEKGVSAEEAVNQVLTEKERKIQEKLEKEAEKELEEGEPNPFSIEQLAEDYAKALAKFERPKPDPEKARENLLFLIKGLIEKGELSCSKCGSRGKFDE